MTPKAFLSHASPDKEFVEAVAKELTRQAVVYDAWTFETSEEFKSSIVKGLEQCTLFVYFATQSSTFRPWVQFEVDEAFYSHLEKRLAKIVVLICDSNTDVSMLPTWLRRAKAERPTSAKHAARIIRTQLNMQLTQRRQQYFVGRGRDKDRLSEQMQPIDGPAHRLVCIVGLRGIGRRTLARHVARDTWSLSSQIEIPLEEGDGAVDIGIKIAAEVEAYNTASGLAEVYKRVRSFSRADLHQYVANCVRRLHEHGELILFIDQGGLLNIDGQIQAEVSEILSAIQQEPNGYAMVITNRVPKQPSPPSFSLKPLSLDDTTRLLRALFEKTTMRPSVAETSELAAYVRGYPPAAYFTVQQCDQYGIPVVVAKKSTLVEFRVDQFLAEIKSAKLGVNECNILRLLETYRPLPLAAIAKAEGLTNEDCAVALSELIERALVTMSRGTNYEVAEPIGEAISRVFGFPERFEHERVFEYLRDAFDRNVEFGADDLMSLARCFYRASIYVGPSTSSSVFALTSDFTSACARFYHEQNYPKCIELAEVVLEQRPDVGTVRSYLVKALAHLERWEEAETHITQHRKFARERDCNFLSGFVNRKRGRIAEAIRFYQKARMQGYRGVSISRELAVCQDQQGNVSEARQELTQALAGDPTNRYLVDLWVKFALRLNDHRDAQLALERLRMVDTTFRYEHRRATAHVARKEYEIALDWARRAVEDAPRRVPFEITAHLIWTPILNDLLEEAEERLNLLERDWGTIRHDVRTGLQCSILLRRRDFRSAYDRCASLKQPDSAYYRRLRRDAIDGMLASPSLRDDDRIRFTRERTGLDGIGGVSDIHWLFGWEDDGDEVETENATPIVPNAESP